MKVLRHVYLSMIMGTFLYVCLQVTTKPVLATPVPSVNKNILHEDTNQHGDWPDEVDDYVKSFLQAGISQNVYINPNDIHIAYQQLPVYTLGQCDTTTHKIVIDPVSFIRGSTSRKEWTIWHELGHCVLGRVQHYNYQTNGYPVSIMYWDSSGAENEYWYYNHREEYIKELFVFSHPMQR